MLPYIPNIFPFKRLNALFFVYIYCYVQVTISVTVNQILAFQTATLFSYVLKYLVSLFCIYKLKCGAVNCIN